MRLYVRMPCQSVQQTSLQIATKVRFPLVLIDANGPNLPFILNRRSVVQRPQSGHSFVARRIESPQVCYADTISV